MRLHHGPGPGRAVAALSCAALVAFAQAAEPPAAAASQALSPQQAQRWLLRIQDAALAGNYRGTLVHSADGSMSSQRVARFCDADGCFERAEALDGRLQQTYRHNGRVATLWPRSRVAVIEERDPRQAVAHPLVEPRAVEHYELREQGPGHVAGRAATVLLFEPRDAWRYPQRLWVDAQTALVLRSDVLGARAQVLESSAFSQVDIGVKERPNSVLQPMRQLDGYRLVRPVNTPTALEAQGWTLKTAVPGFALTGCSLRSLDAAADGSAGAPVLQAVFSDGLTQVSLFIEPLDPQRHRQPLQLQTGATHTLMEPRGPDWWLTVIGDVPAATLKQFVQALERRR